MLPLLTRPAAADMSCLLVTGSELRVKVLSGNVVIGSDAVTADDLVLLPTDPAGQGDITMNLSHGATGRGAGEVRILFSFSPLTVQELDGLNDDMQQDDDEEVRGF